ncbi:MAG: family 10 glycosylhydrolase [Clostridia bacterium]|nr:family 10 glycosylhydrolase [Clostridia bacterium]
MKPFGVWMWPATLVRDGVQAVFDNCARLGLTDVYLLTKGLDGTAAFLTELTPPMYEGRDILREALDAAHARGLRVHTWFTSASDAAYKRAHPEAGVYHLWHGRDRNVISLRDGRYADYMRRVIADMLNRYDCDGLHLDYIRYNHLLCGWSPEDRAYYESRGVDVERALDLIRQTFPQEGSAQADGESDQGPVFQAYRRGDEAILRLAEARRADVNAFARALIEPARSLKPGLTVSAAFMPEGAYDDLAFSDLHYGQHYADLAPLMDAILPMAYSADYKRDASWVGGVTRNAKEHGKPVFTGLQAYDPATPDTLRADADAARLRGADGLCLFRYATLKGRFEP